MDRKSNHSRALEWYLREKFSTDELKRLIEAAGESSGRGFSAQYQFINKRMNDPLEFTPRTQERLHEEFKIDLPNILQLYLYRSKKNDSVNSTGDRNVVGRNVSEVEYVNGEATVSVLLDRIAALEKQLAEKDAQIAKLLNLLSRD